MLILRLFIITLCASFLPVAKASTQSCAGKAGVDYAQFEGTVQNLRQQYRSGRFSQLDETLYCLTKSPERFQSGKSGASAVYWMFRREMPGPGVNPDESNHLQKWKHEKPQSMFVRFGELRLQYATSWNARGSDVASKVTKENWQRFNEGLAKAEQAVLAAPDEIKSTPITQNLLIAILLDRPESKTSPRTAFEEGVRRWPDYYDFYELMLTRLVPRWGGSWDAVDAFIVEWSKRLAKTEGDSMYARLYLSMITAGVDPWDTRLNWPRMKSSLEELVGKYPDPVFKNLAASFACRYADGPQFQASLQRITPQQLDRSIWLDGTNPEICARMAAARRL